MSRDELLAVLQQGLQELGEDPAAHPCQRYLDYLSLLQQWNRAYNLTGVRELQRMLPQHLLDSLAVLPFLRGNNGLDVGSGAGLPGLVLALARPDWHWCLLDSNTKKVRFLRQALLEFKLANVEVVQTRIEDYRPAEAYATIIARAWIKLPGFYQQVAPLAQKPGRLIAMKGAKPEQELRQLREAGISCSVHAVRVPGLGKQRHLVVMDIT